MMLHGAPFKFCIYKVSPNVLIEKKIIEHLKTSEWSKILLQHNAEQ